MSNVTSGQITIGEKLESFYLALLTYQSVQNEENIYRLARSLEALETHTLNSSVGESKDIIEDILKDARKKSGQLIRSPYIDDINQLITSARKRLKTKIALNDENSQFQHGQRYLHLFIELLGTWSNMITHINHFGFSKEMIPLLLSSLHNRIIEMSFECFLTFKSDKDIDNWVIRANNFNTGTESDQTTINLSALDGLLSQIAMMRKIINQHYLFLFHSFHGYFDDEPEENNEETVAKQQQNSETKIEQSAIPSTGSNVNVQESTDKSNIQQVVASNPKKSTASTVSHSFLDHLLIVSSSELLKWKEIDIIYIALEGSYLQQSIIEACLNGCSSALSLEENIYILEMFEDSLYLFHKILERSISTNEEKCVFMIANKFLELFLFQYYPASSVSSSSFSSDCYQYPSLASSTQSSLFGKILLTKKLFNKCLFSSSTVHDEERRKKKIEFEMRKILSDFTGRNYLPSQQLDEQPPSNRSDGQPEKQQPSSSDGTRNKDGKLGANSSSSSFKTPMKAPSSADGNNNNNSQSVSMKDVALETTKNVLSSFFNRKEEHEDGDSNDETPDNNKGKSNLWNEVTNASLTGVNQWIGWASPYLSQDNSGHNSNKDTPPGSLQKGTERKNPSVPQKPKTMEEMVLHALDLADSNDDNDINHPRAVRVPSLEEDGDPLLSLLSAEHREVRYNGQLVEKDFIVYLNCLTVMMKALLSLRSFLLENGLSVLSVDQIVKQEKAGGATTKLSQQQNSTWLLIKVRLDVFVVFSNTLCRLSFVFPFCFLSIVSIGVLEM
jgi:hypothetical protein